MKRLILILLLAVLTNVYSIAQTKQDPFHGHYKLGSSSEIALFIKTSPQNNQFLKHQIFRYYSGSGKYYMDSASSGLYTGNLDPKFSGQDTPPYYFRAVSGDFTGSGLDNIAAAWIANDSSIQIVVPKINKGNLTWNDQDVISIPYEDLAPFNMNNYEYSRFDLIKGYFDSSPNPQFALAFWNKDGYIEIRIYGLDPNTLLPVKKADMTTGVYMDPAADNTGNYGIAAGDFNGDGIDEIVLADAENTIINTRVYEVVSHTGNLSLVLKCKNNGFDASIVPLHLRVVTGNFLNNTLDQFVVDYNYENLTFQYVDLLLPASVDTSLSSININPANLEQVSAVEASNNRQISIVSGDLNNDGRDEILADANNATTLFTVDDTLHLHKVATINGNTNPVIADLDAGTADSVWTPEIICTAPYFSINNNIRTVYTYFHINVFEPLTDQSGNITSIQKRASILADSTKNNSEDYHWTITAGAYDGKNIRLGTPRHYRATNIIQPLVILNAPPTHFDVFNDSTFDINNMYNGNGAGDFFAEYYTKSQSDIQVRSEIHSDWTVGATVTGGFKIPIVNTGVKIKLESDYGKKFSKVVNSSHTYSVSDNITATLDDRIYATTVDYDIWEYPILADDSLKGYTLTVVPGSVTKTWFPSKSPDASEYIPNHELGNILSYPEIANPSDNPALKSAIKWSSSDAIVLDRSTNSSYDWALETKTKTDTQTTNEVDWHVGATASFDVPFKFIPDVELRGDYSHTSISTRTNEVTFTNGLDVHLGPVSSGLGIDYYSVTPYAYWSKNGSLVLDYAVKPDIAGINKPETFWQQRYGHKSDPALILPWRLDNYKGANDPVDQLQETKDIIFNPDNPKPGDTVNIQVRIHNFSLINTPGPVNARLYVGNPSKGGTLIKSVNGNTTFHTSDVISARGSSIINFNWKLPDNTPAYPRIYVVINPDHQIDEIHKTNDIGWKVLQYSNGTTAVQNKSTVVNNFKLSQNYPNPFNPSTKIRYSIPYVGTHRDVSVRINVYDVLGRKIATLVNKKQQPGNYEVTFDGSSFASGIYFYRLQADGFTKVKKMILLK